MGGLTANTPKFDDINNFAKKRREARQLDYLDTIPPCPVVRTALFAQLLYYQNHIYDLLCA